MVNDEKKATVYISWTDYTFVYSFI